jgi:hypothetical protein
MPSPCSGFQPANRLQKKPVINLNFGAFRIKKQIATDRRLNEKEVVVVLLSRREEKALIRRKNVSTCPLTYFFIELIKMLPCGRVLRRSFIVK